MNIRKLVGFTNNNRETKRSDINLNAYSQLEIKRAGKKLSNKANAPDRCIISFSSKNIYTEILLETKNKKIRFKPFEMVKNINSYNFNCQSVVKVGQNVYRGGKPLNEDAIKELKVLGIDTIICFLKKDRLYDEQIKNWKEEKKLAKKYGINLIHIPMDEKKGPSERDIKRFLKLYKNRHNKPIYFHCYAGQDRAGIMGAIADIEIFNMTFNQAFSRMLDQNHDFSRFKNLDAYLYKYCLNKGEKPENMHPKEILEKYINTGFRFKNHSSSFKKSLIEKVLNEIKTQCLTQ